MMNEGRRMIKERKMDEKKKDNKEIWRYGQCL